MNEAIERTEILNSRAAKAKDRELRESEKYTWKGVAFPLFKNALSRPETVADLVVVTARWHADWEFRLFLKQLKEMEIVRNDYGIDPRDKKRTFPRFHSLAEPEALQFGRYSLGQKKANVVQAEAAQLLNSPTELHEELSSDPDEAARGVRNHVHTAIVAEDDPRNVEPIRKTLEALSGDLYYTHKVKFVLLNAAPEAELTKARWPWRWTVFHKGFGRPALPEEIRQWQGTDCEGLLK